MKHMRYSILALSVALTGCSSEPEGPSGIDVISAETLSQNIQTLSSDEFEGRGPASLGEEKTVAFLIEKFSELGLKGANNGDFVQDLPLQSIEAGNDTTLSVKAGGATIDLAYLESQVTWTRQSVPSLGVMDSELVFVGYGINAPERGWNDYEGIDVTDKTVLILINDPGYATQDPELFDGNAMTLYGRWGPKLDEAARQGASGAIIIHDTKPASYGWSTVQNSWSGPQFALVRPDGGASLSQFEGWITKSMAETILKATGNDLSDLMEKAKTPGFKAVPLAATVSAGIRNKLSRVNSRNVAAILEGDKYPDEVFIYMAHWDHLGMNPLAKPGEDAIYNGALDNATGTAGLIEMARAFTTLPEKPERSIMFLAVGAEEQGLLGSAYYAENPLRPLAKTVGGLNMDGLNNFGPTKDIEVIGMGNSSLEETLAVAAGAERYLRPDSSPEKGYFFRSDHFSLMKKGVPMLYPSNGIDHVTKGEAYGQAKADEYTANHYHGPSDEWSPEWDMTGAEADLKLFFKVGNALVSSREWPQWVATSPFKAVRDTTQDMRKSD